MSNSNDEWITTKQQELQLPLRVYHNKIYQRVNTQNIHYLQLGQSIIVQFFDDHNKLFFVGKGKLKKINSDTTLTIKLHPIVADTSSEFSFVSPTTVSNCKHWCNVTFVPDIVQDRNPRQRHLSPEELFLKQQAAQDESFIPQYREYMETEVAQFLDYEKENTPYFPIVFASNLADAKAVLFIANPGLTHEFIYGV